LVENLCLPQQAGVPVFAVGDGREEADRAFAWGVPSSEDVPPPVEFWNEYGVPEIDILIVGFDCLRGAHERRP
jgi:hypothetical protein